jgi:hypothetical protein
MADDFNHQWGRWEEGGELQLQRVQESFVGCRLLWLPVSRLYGSPVMGRGSAAMEVEDDDLGKQDEKIMA